MSIRGLFFTSKYRIGDRVIHRATQQRGTVEETQTMGGVDRISVRLDLGGDFKLADRREFMLATKG